MKKFIPLIVGLLTISTLLYLPFRTKLLAIMWVLFAIPLSTYSLRDKEAGELPYHGCLIGIIAGVGLGVVITNFVMHLLFENMVKYSIRLDLVLGAFFGASILSSLGIILGGWLSQRKKTGA